MNYSALLTVSAAIFTLTITGYVLNRLKILDSSFTRRLSTLLGKLAQPCLIIYSIIKLEYSAERLGYGLTVTALGITSQLIMGLFAFFAFKFIRNTDERKLTEFGFIFSNCAFVGYPILESLFGDIGLFFGAFYSISFNLLLRSYGVMIMMRGKEGYKFKLRQLLLNAGTFACTVGLALHISRVPVPEFILKSMNYIASLCTPISLLIIGSLLAYVPIKKLFSRWQLYVYCALKLLVYPIALAFVCKLVGLDRIDCGINLAIFIPLMASVPPAAFTAVFAEMYDVEPTYAGHLVAIGTLFSPVTVPVVV